MPQTFSKGFLLREPPRSSSMATGAALVGKALVYAPRRQVPASIPGAKDLNKYGQAAMSGSVLTPSSRVQNPSSIAGALENENRGNSRSSNVGVLVPRGDGFRSPRVKKGRIVNRRTGEVHPFMFNPTEISREDAWEWAEHKIPGASHPIASGGTGGKRIISFTLYFDGDRGRSELRERFTGQTTENQRVPAGDPRSLDISDELDFYRSYTYPRIPTDVFQDRGPDRLILSYGTWFKRVECTMHSCSVVVTATTPFGEPLRATAKIQLEETVRRSVSCTDIWPDKPGTSVSMDGVVGGDIG